MKRRSKTGTPKVCLFCRIDLADVEAMLDAYDSGMCDITTANCVSRAVARQLCSECRIRLHRHSHTCADLEIRGQNVPISAELLEWLGTAETGSRVDPVEFVLEIPGPDVAESEALPRRVGRVRKKRGQSSASVA
ncbi:MAG: hypothetical protein KDN18_07760 [Verrucomicrobiae bacterium]|nr:hypothetical protein [Verrucomicrobiae bacterium]